MALELQQPNTTQNSQSFSRSVVRMLPTEMVVDILLRLPVESLLRCKSVCKLWCSLISDPFFVKSHLTLSNNADRSAHRRVIYKMGRNFKTCHVDVLFDDPISDLGVDCPFNGDLWVVGSCNGLLCMSNWSRTMVVWNPSTRKSNYLPSHEVKPGFRVYGFGYDEATDDYKAVAVYYDLTNIDWRVTSVMIYSLKTGIWKEISVFPDGSIPLGMFSGKFLNGALHWVATKGAESSLLWTIISLDLANETYGEVLQPEYDESFDGLTLGDLREWLCVCCSYSGIRIDMWVMKVYGVEDSWTRLVSIPYPADLGWYHFSMRFYILHDGKFWLQHGSNVIVYDSKNDSSSKCALKEHFQPWIYAESLVSPVPLAGPKTGFKRYLRWLNKRLLPAGQWLTKNQDQYQNKLTCQCFI